MNRFLSWIFLLVFSVAVCEERLDLQIITYEDLVNEKAEALALLKEALYEQGIVGVKGIPGYKEKVERYIETARGFSALPEEVKEQYAPKKGDMFLGYERGKEKFKRPDGKWVIDDLKTSYYALVPDTDTNRWPNEVDLRSGFQDVGTVMAQVGEMVMRKVGLIEDLSDHAFGRMLYYRKSSDSREENPYWCGAHFDHGLFTALLPAFYFVEGEAVKEPDEAGLFVRTGGTFKKVVSDDPDVLLFQVGEYGQLMTDDGIRATEHRVHKAEGNVERFTLALFFSPPMDTGIFSRSELTKDARYGGEVGEFCTYRHWHEESFKRYIVKD